MNYCPCCSNPLLLHIRGSETYWFCRHCWQEMPVLSRENSSSLREMMIEKLMNKLQNQAKHHGTVPVT
ncbi:hypothetical protein QUB80_18855 [Chlorogloeopsis sp. ULAP01]|uniref:hypothetical protein n=1 Tax=Chlorogloeopsis sp. ULAP01 TaxID=3056483 RepID=UPI0025AAE360|nr:hypothetical protein [Chlorogloeopsis sp. ULAP01]MDM9382756.1 hypothetical protein [Chlorogloeopsis sp. ULAP01]